MKLKKIVRAISVLAGCLTAVSAFSDPIVDIYDLDDTTGITALLSGFDAATLNSHSSIATDGTELFDAHGEWLSTTSLNPGDVVAVKFNFFEPGANNVLSDTLVLTFTGQQPTLSDPANISLDLHFRSEGDPGIALTPLVGGIDLNEIPWATGVELSDYVKNAGGPSDISVKVRSEVPEASSPLITAGVLLPILADLRRRARARKAKA